MNYLSRGAVCVLLLVSFIFISQPVVGRQTDGYDTLVQAYAQSKNDSVSIKLLDRMIVSLWLSGAYDSSQAMVNELFAIAKRNSWNNANALAYKHLGIIAQFRGQLDQSIDYSLQAEAIYMEDSASNAERLAAIHNNLGIAYAQKGLYKTALRYLLYCVRHDKATDNTRALASLYANLGNLYENIKEYDQSLHYLELSLSMSREVNSPYDIANALSNMGNLLISIRQHQLAKGYLAEALVLNQQNKDKEGRGFNHNNLARAYLALGLVDSAQYHANAAITIRKQLGDVLNVSTSYHTLFDVLLNKKAYTQAKEVLRQSASNLAGFSAAPAQAWELYQRKYRLDSAQGNYKSALTNYLQYIAIRDSVYSDESTHEIARLEAQYEYDLKAERLVAKQEVRLEQEAAALERQQLLTIGIAVVLVLVLLVAAVIFVHRQKLKTANNELQERNYEVNQQKEELTAQADELQRLHHLKDKLFSVISHDVRAPMADLSAFLTMLEGESLTQARVNELIPGLTRQFDHTLSLIDNLLQWARSQMTGLQIRPDYVDFTDIAEAVSGLFTRRADDKGVLLRNLMVFPAIVFADADMVQLVLRNLVANALKFTSQGGQVNISALREGDFLEVQVSDTGKGMNEGEMQELFGNKGYSTPGTDQEKGTGLGLLLSKEFIEKNGGAIKAESKPGRGSTFSFTIPLFSPEDKPKVQGNAVFTV